MRLRSRVLLASCALAAGVPVASAHASEPMSDSNAKLQSLQVNSKGEALVTYRRTDGKVRRVLVWGAVNSAISGEPSARQVRFKYDYAGGWGKYHKASYWSTFRNRCAPYDGPALVYFVAALQGARRNLLGDPVVAATPAAARLRSLAARADGLRVPPLALEQRARRRSRSTPTGRTAARGRASSGGFTLPRPADLRVRLDGRGQPEGPLRAERLHRHVQLGLRAGLEA